MRHLGQLEAAVMERLWSWGEPAAVREVLEDLQEERDIAYTTVMIVMDNLHRKGVLDRERRGRAYVYQPAQTREEYTAMIMEQALSAGGDPAATLLHFVKGMSPPEVAGLREALNGLKPRGKGGRK